MRPSIALVVLLGLTVAAATANSQTPSAADLARAMRSELGTQELIVAPIEAEVDAGGILTILVPIAGNDTALLLHPHSVRSGSFQLLVEDEHRQLDGVRAERADSFRGEAFVPGNPFLSGAVTATYRAGLLDASVVLNDGSRYQVQPVSRTLPEAPVGFHAVIQTAAAGPASGIHPASAGAPPLASLAASRIVEIAIDADVEFFQQHGSSLANTLADIENVMNGVSALWEAEVGARFEITTVIVRTAEADPYTFTLAGGLLNQFKGHWSTTKGAVHRDVAHLLTGKDLDGTVFGASFYSVVCSLANGYSLSQSHAGTNLDERVAAASHHIARNFSANTCDGEPDCAVMCTTINGCHGMTTFGATAEVRIGNTLAAQPCLSDLPPAALLPFEDTFPADVIDASLWTHVNGATVDNCSVAPPSGTRALRLGASSSGPYDDDEIRSNFIDLSTANSATLTFSTEHRGVEAGEELVVEFAEDSLSWVELARYGSDGVDQVAFVPRTIQLPPAALPAECRLRFRAEANDTGDAWYVDDVLLLEIDYDPPVLSNLSFTPDPYDLAEQLSVSVTAVDVASGVATVVADWMDGVTQVAQISLAHAGSDLYTGTFPAGLSLAEKPYQLVVTATDTQTNSAQDSTSVTPFDLPFITAPMLLPATPVDTDSLTVSVAVSDTSLLQAVTAESRLDGGSFRQINLSYNGSSERFEGSFSPSAAGELVVTFRATDVPGNNAAPVLLTRQIYPAGGVAPAVSGLALTPDPVEAGQSLTISALVTDPDSPVPTVTAALIQNASQLAQISLTEGSGNQFSGTFAGTPGLVAGGFSVEVTAEDMQDNGTTRSVPGTAYEAPIISAVTVTPSSFDATESYQVSAQVSHPVGVSWVKGAVSLNGAAYQEQDLSYNGSSGQYEGNFPPTGAGGSLTVRIRAAGSDGYEATPAFTPVTVDYAPIALTAVTPDGGSIAGGTTIVLTGTGLKVDVVPGSARVLVGGVDATGVTLVADDELRAVTPAGGSADTVSVEVRVSKGGNPFSASLPAAFTYGVEPSITSVAPASGSAYTANRVLLRGSGFSGSPPGTTTVTVGGRAATEVDVIDDQTVSALLPPSGEVGSVEAVTLACPLGVSTLPQAFTSLGTLLRGLPRVVLPVSGSVRSMAILDDLDGDGTFEVACGVPDASAGKVLVRRGSDLSYHSLLTSPTAGGTLFGQALLVVADLDGDGVGDLVVGEPGAGAVGAVRAINPVSGAEIWSCVGSETDGQLGFALASLGDLNGDGKTELAAGLPGSDQVWILDGQSGAQLGQMTGVTSSERFGAVLAARLPQDAAADRPLLIGAPLAAPGGVTGAGRADLFLITPTSLTITPSVSVAGVEAGGATGPAGEPMGLALLGGTSELVALGLPGSDLAGTDAGLIAVVDSADGSLVWSQAGLWPGDLLGSSLSACSDYDDDGHLDLAAGAPGEDTETGSLRLYSGIDGSHLVSAPGLAQAARHGTLVVTSQNFGADPLPRILVASTSGASPAVTPYQLHPSSFAPAATMGDRLAGALPDPLDFDGLRFDLVSGETVSITMTFGKKDRQQAALYDGDGTPLLCSDPDSPYFDSRLVKRKKKSLALKWTAAQPVTLHLVLNAPQSPYTQGYNVKTKRKTKSPLVITQDVLFDQPSAPLSFPLYAIAGSKLGGSLTAKPASIDVAVTALWSPAGENLFTLHPSAFKTSSKGHKVTIKESELTLTETGSYDLRFQPDQTATGKIKVKLAIYLPKGKARLQDGD